MADRLTKELLFTAQPNFRAAAACAGLSVPAGLCRPQRTSRPVQASAYQLRTGQRPQVVLMPHHAQHLRISLMPGAQQATPCQRIAMWRWPACPDVPTLVMLPAWRSTIGPPYTHQPPPPACVGAARVEQRATHGSLDLQGEGRQRQGVGSLDLQGVARQRQQSHM